MPVMGREMSAPIVRIGSGEVEHCLRRSLWGRWMVEVRCKYLKIGKAGRNDVDAIQPETPRPRSQVASMSALRPHIACSVRGVHFRFKSF